MFCQRSFSRSCFNAVISAGFAGLPVAHGASPFQIGQMTVTSYSFSGDQKPAPRWSNGALLATEGIGTPSVVVHLFNRQGQEVLTIPFAIPNANWMGIFGGSAAHAPNGSVVLGGSAQDAQGHVSGFLALVAPDGLSTKIVRTDSYSPNNVTVAPDGTIWTQGMEIDPSVSPPGKGLKPGAGTIRHFDENGKALAAFIPQSSVARVELTSGSPVLAASSTRVGWHANLGHSYYEITSDGKVQQYPGLRVSALETVEHLVITENGDVFASKDSPGEVPPESLFTLDRAKAIWNRVVLPGGDVSHPLLLGGEGNTLVFRARGTAAFRFAFFEIR